MIRSEPDSFDALLRELLVERFYTTSRDVPSPIAALDRPEVCAYRRQMLSEALDDVSPSSPIAPVVPIRRQRAA